MILVGNDVQRHPGPHQRQSTVAGDVCVAELFKELIDMRQEMNQNFRDLSGKKSKLENDMAGLSEEILDLRKTVDLLSNCHRIYLKLF